VIRIGAQIKQGDILVGQGDAEGRNATDAGEKLLRAIFAKRPAMYATLR